MFGHKQINLIFYETFRFLSMFRRLLTSGQNIQNLTSTNWPSVILKVNIVIEGKKRYFNQIIINDKFLWLRLANKCKWGIEKSVDTQCCARGNQLQCLFWGYLGPADYYQSDK